VTNLKDRMRRKAQLFPGRFDLALMRPVRTVREFDDVVTATYCGFRGASDYYERSSALRVIANIHAPTFIITAQDDPFVPFSSFSDPDLTNNSSVALAAPRHGGHCAFISKESGEERFWAEARITEFCRQVSESASRQKKSEEALER